MDTRYFFKENYWKYYKELERQVADTEKYIAFSKKNNGCYSLEYLKLFQTICSEIDVVSKAIAQYLNEDFIVDNNTTIRKWGKELTDCLPELMEWKVIFNDNNLLTPWEKFGYESYYDSKNSLRYRLCAGKKTPTWWDDYNKVKHGRILLRTSEKNYERANQKNVIDSLAALFALESVFMYRHLGYMNIDSCNWTDRKGCLFSVKL